MATPRARWTYTISPCSMTCKHPVLPRVVRGSSAPDSIASVTAKVDFKKSLDTYRARAGEFCIVQVRPLRYLMVDGHGDPNTAQEYADALAALYPVAYKLKFASKQELGQDYVVPPLEALWWASDMEAFTSARDKAQWDWTLMLMVPDWITPQMLDAALAKAAAKDRPVSLEKLRDELLVEGTSVQTLHLGPYDDESATLSELHHDFIPSHGLRMTGKHHEIYLSDPRRVIPSKLRTILRQPVEPVV